jgi:hypothetical protein
MTDCPNCEYHRQRAQRWREEAYKQAGHPLPEREWVGLTDEEILKNQDIVENSYSLDLIEFARAIEAKLKEKNITPYCGHEETIVKGSLVHCKKCNYCFGVD